MMNINEKLENELAIYKKAYKMLALSFCEKGNCVFCEMLSNCKKSEVDERGSDVTMRHFLQKAREQG